MNLMPASASGAGYSIVCYTYKIKKIQMMKMEFTSKEPVNKEKILERKVDLFMKSVFVELNNEKITRPNFIALVEKFKQEYKTTYKDLFGDKLANYLSLVSADTKAKKPIFYSQNEVLKKFLKICFEKNSLKDSSHIKDTRNKLIKFYLKYFEKNGFLVE